MTLQIIGALLAAFCITKVFGKRLIPWLEKHGIRQPTKDEVEQKIYSKKMIRPIAAEKRSLLE